MQTSLLIAVLSAVLALAACPAPDASVDADASVSPDAPAVVDSDNEIDQLFAALGGLQVEAPRRVEGPASAPSADGDYQCVVTPVDEVRQFDQLLGQLTVGDVLWPGSMVRGDSVATGQLAPLVFERAPLTFSVSLESLTGTRSATLAAPSLSSYRDAIGQILAQQLQGQAPARIYAEVEEVSSAEQLAVALGAAATAPLVATVKAGFDFNDTTKRTRYLVKFFQLYYTVDLDPPSLPHELFGPSVTAAAVRAAIGAAPPVYVSSIGYGRQVVFTFESELSKAELSAALDFVYQGGAAVSGSVSLTHQEVLEHTHTTAFILGGAPGEGVAAAIGGYAQLRTFIERGGSYSSESPGAAIAYKLAYVRDNTPVRVSYASAYGERACARTTQRLHVVFEKLKVDDAGSDVGGDLEVFGTVEVRGTGAPQALASWPAAMYQQIAAGASAPASGIIGEAIVPVRPAAGNAVTIRTSLLEADTFANDSFGDAVEDAAPFEAGWRRTLQVHRSSGAQAITLQIAITPVP
ncbi:MAG: thiol-activated cytolysin family protein [Kofleriaceae bacterium]